MRITVPSTLAVAAVALLLGGQAQATEVVNLYSARQESLIKPLLDRFTAESGIEVNLVTGKAETLLQRLRSEGANSPADLFITTDAGRLQQAVAAGVTQPIHSARLEAAIPATYRDPEGQWFGLSVRARPIFYVKGKLDPQQIHSYADLTDPQWHGRICIRSSDNIYNQSLVASMIAHQGVAPSEVWAEGLVANLARKPTGGDRDQIKAAAAGQCDLAVANTYYYAAMLESSDPQEQAAARKLGVIWPEQEGRGTHVNVSGAALTKSARHKEAAIALLEFLVSDAAQVWYAETNQEYPVKPGVPWSATLEQLGHFKADTINATQLGEFNAEAVKLMDRVGWR